MNYMTTKKEKKQKKERSKKEWKERLIVLKALLTWWLEVHPEPKKQVKRYVNSLKKRIKEAEEALA
jgi:hypothetical protein